MDSNATVILAPGELTGGTLLTLTFCEQHGKPVLVIDATKTAESEAPAQIVQFVERSSFGVLNVAGPRASGWPQAHEYAQRTVETLLAVFQVSPASESQDTVSMQPSSRF